MGKTKLTKKNFTKVMQAIRESANESDGQEAATMVSTMTGVLERLVASGGPVAAAAVEATDKALDDLVRNDFYGTEAQLDPRGDQRE